MTWLGVTRGDWAGLGMTKNLSRRSVLKSIAVGTAGMALAAPAIGQKRYPHIVIIGGGVGGATLARHIALTAPGELAITLVEPNQRYRTCFFSNLMMAGLHGGLTLDHDYTALQKEIGIFVRHDVAVQIEPAKRLVTLASGTLLQYDRLVLSPGIDFKTDAIEGYDAETALAMPHAWRADQKIELLAARIKAMPAGGTFAMVAPPNPYRCPPGPYERVSMIAHVLKQTNPTAKILLIDNKDAFAKQALFQDGWKRYYGDMIEWLPQKAHGGVKAVSAKTGKIICEFAQYKVDAACLVPPQQAGAIARNHGLTDANGWCPIVAETMQSASDPNIHIIGDATRAAAMPKSAESAANQARLAGNAICRALTPSQPYEGRIANTCWSLVAEGDGVKVGATYAAAGDKFIKTSEYISTLKEHPTMRVATYKESLGWYQHVVGNMFGGYQG